MTDTTGARRAATAPKTTPMRTVIAASAAGTAFEWYDFFIFGSLQAIIAKTFFAELAPVAGQIAALALFGVGFAFRPLGALIFGRVGDVLGRKAAFLICVSMMGGATFAIGLLPSYQMVGVTAPVLLIALRIVQGTALGGQYGGAAIYVAEHARADRRGWATGWVQTSAAFGLVAALAVIFVTRRAVGEAAFSQSRLDRRLAHPVLRLGRPGGDLDLDALAAGREPGVPAHEGRRRRQPAPPTAMRSASWSNLKLVLLAFFALMMAQGAYWYTVFFYSAVFLQTFLKVDADFTNLMILLAALLVALRSTCSLPGCRTRWGASR